MLSRNENIVDSEWLDSTSWLFFVFNNNLRFAIWSQPWNLSVLSLGSHNFTDLICKNMRAWMEKFFIPFISGITEHESLITSSHIFIILVFMYRSSNICILSVYINNNITFFAVKADIIAYESDFFACSSGDCLKIWFFTFDCDFSEKTNLFLPKNFKVRSFYY